MPACAYQGAVLDFNWKHLHMDVTSKYICHVCFAVQITILYSIYYTTYRLLSHRHVAIEIVSVFIYFVIIVIVVLLLFYMPLCKKNKTVRDEQEARAKRGDKEGMMSSKGLVVSSNQWPLWFRPQHIITFLLQYTGKNRKEMERGKTRTMYIQMHVCSRHSHFTNFIL